MKKFGLLTREGADGQQTFFVDPFAVLGSASSCEVVVRNAAPQHCRIFRSREGYEARDLTGQGLIRINGKPTPGTMLRDGDTLEIGSCKFRFSEGFEADAPGEAPAPKESTTRRVPRATPTTGKIKIVPPSIPKRRVPVVPLIAAGAFVLAAVLALLLIPGGTTAPSKATRTAALPKESAPSASASGSRRMDVDSGQTPAAAPPEKPEPSAAPPGPPDTRGHEPLRIAARTLPVPEATTPARSPLSGLDALLRDPSRKDRASLAQAIRAVPLDSEVLRAAALALSWSPNPWDLRGADAAVWSTYLKQTSFETLDALSAPDHVARARILLDGGRNPLFRLFALAHLVEALSADPSVSGLLQASGFRPGADGRRWGDADADLHRRATQYFRGRARDDAALEAKTLAGAPFATRYAGLLLEIERSLARGAGTQSTFNDLASTSAPAGFAGGAAHLRALTESYRKAVYCKECRNGRLPCPQCQGKTRIDLPCVACKGEGRTLAPGAVDGAQVTQICRNCEGHKIFRQVGCPTCSRSGSVGCTSCGGDPWRERRCTNPVCRSGWIRCEPCRGGGRVDVSCPECSGTGRVMAPGAVNGARVTQKCRTCNEDHGVFKKAGKCPDCTGTGLVRCAGCTGKSEEPKTALAPLSGVFTTEACGDCAGAGWPSSRMDVPCARCLGLGVRVKPAIDPSKTLE